MTKWSRRDALTSQSLTGHHSEAKSSETVHASAASNICAATGFLCTRKGPCLSSRGCRPRNAAGVMSNGRSDSDSLTGRPSGIKLRVDTELSHSIDEGGSVDTQADCSTIRATDAALACGKRLYDFFALLPFILLGASVDGSS